MSILPSYEIPAIRELAKYRQWVIWDQKKIPYTDYGVPADTTSPKTWCSFDSAVSTLVDTKVIRNPQGVGFVFGEPDPFIGIDLDKCYNKETREIEPWARKILDTLDSYVEKSPSENGFHVIVRANVDLPFNKVKVEGGVLEIYKQSRYFTVTGWHVDPYPEEIQDRNDELLTVIAEHRPVNVPAKSTVQSGQGDIDYDLRADAEYPGAKYDALRENDKNFQRTWDKKRPDLGSQSEYEMSLMMYAVQAKWAPSECASLIICHRRKHDPDKLSKVLRYDYIHRTYTKARSAVSDGVDESDIQEFNEIKESIEAGPEETLTMLSSRLGVVIDGTIRRGSEDTQYYIVIQGREVLLGGSEDLFSLSKVRAKLFDVTGKPIKNHKQPVWLQIAQGIFAIAKFEEIQGNNRCGELISWVTDYTMAKGLMEEDKYQDAIVALMPYKREGRVHIYADKLRDWLRFTKDVKITIGDLRIRLREAGFDAKSATGRSRGKRITKSFWSAPMSVIGQIQGEVDYVEVDEINPSHFSDITDDSEL